MSTSNEELERLAQSALPQAVPAAPVAFVIRNTVDVPLSFPHLYPTTKDTPFVFSMRVQLVGDAENIQRDFLMKPDEEQQGDLLHVYDVEMIARLSVKAPVGFPDFPEVDESSTEALTSAIRDYFLPADLDRRSGMAYITRFVMNRYWRMVEPADYL